jgi:hypothetical protein
VPPPVEEARLGAAPSALLGGGGRPRRADAAPSALARGDRGIGRERRPSNSPCWDCAPRVRRPAADRRVRARLADRPPRRAGRHRTRPRWHVRALPPAGRQAAAVVLVYQAISLWVPAARQRRLPRATRHARSRASPGPDPRDAARANPTACPARPGEVTTRTAQSRPAQAVPPCCRPAPPFCTRAVLDGEEARLAAGALARPACRDAWFRSLSG